MARLWVHVAADKGEAEPGEEPLAVRLSLLRHRYHEPVSGAGAAPYSDAETLARWRALVAQWARSPSGAMSREHADAVTDALADDLDTPAALRALDGLAGDPGIPDGVKFETFAAADRLLGLDLARDIGQ
jgi:cysteinyl-tRNA synthetase